MSGHGDDQLMPPGARAVVLDAEIRRLQLDGYTVESRPSRHLVVMNRDSHRLQIFVNEFGEVSSS